MRMADSLTEQLIKSLTGPSRGRNLSLVFVLLLSVVGFGSLIFWNSKPDYQVLFSNLSPEDAGEIIGKLKEKKILYQLAFNGTTLLVAKDQVYETRLSLANDGLPKGGGVGFEVFDRTSLGTTDFVQKLNYLRALQGELSRTIKQIKEVDQVRVHIVVPKESLFVEEQKKATASVFVKTRAGMTLGSSQVDGIVRLVASAVEGLDPGEITVVDTSGKVLSKKQESNPIGQLTNTQLEYQRSIEEGLKKKVQGMLEEVLGFSKAIARVSADIDFQQVESTEEKYDPAMILRSEQKNTERSTSSTGGMAGEAKPESPPDAKAPKSKSNPSLEGPAKPQSGPSSSPMAQTSERQQETRNYEISKINKRVKNPVGSVRKISTAVIVDGIYKEAADANGKKERQYAPRSQEEMKNIENIVKKAIGYDQERGDQVEVITMPFYWSGQEDEGKPLKGSPWQEYLLMAYKPAVSLILALLFIFFVARPVIKKRVLSPERGVPLLQSVPAPMIASQAPQEVREAGPMALRDLRDQTLKLVQGDPSKTVGIVKSWLHERE
jgi:flagellar M-ring protein FliF